MTCLAQDKALRRTHPKPTIEENTLFRFFRRLLQDIHPAGWLALSAHLARSAARVLAERHRRAIAYRDLQTLDSHMLRDLGLSHRAAAEYPCDRFGTR